MHDTKILLKTNLLLENIIKIGFLVYCISCFNLVVVISDFFDYAVHIFIYHPMQSVKLRTSFCYCEHFCLYFFDICVWLLLTSMYACQRELLHFSKVKHIPFFIYMPIPRAFENCAWFLAWNLNHGTLIYICRLIAEKQDLGHEWQPAFWYAEKLTLDLPDIYLGLKYPLCSKELGWKMLIQPASGVWFKAVWSI